MMAPPRARIIIFTNDKSDSNIRKAIMLTIKEAKNPAIYPITVFLLFLGKLRLPNRIPKIDAAPSPNVAISAAAAKIPNGKKKIGTKARTKAAGFVNS